jgi:hypothetical protein
MTADNRKLIFASLYLICVTVLMAIGRVGSAEGLPAIAILIGYLLGNGSNSIKGRVSTPVLMPKETQVDKEPSESSD